MRNSKQLADFIQNRFNGIDKDELNAALIYYDSPYGDSLDELMWHIRDYTEAQDFKYGCTKLVLFFDEFPQYVFKIPFAGYVDYYAERSWKQYDDVEQFFIDDIEDNYACINKHLNDFAQYDRADKNGEYDCNKYDYCGAESYVYKMAEQYNVSSLFAKTEYLCDIAENVPVYVSERCESYVLQKSYKKCSKDSKSYAKSFENLYHTDCDSHDLACFVEDYGPSLVEKYLNFVKFFKVNDITEVNLGIGQDGLIKVVDYSGYNEVY